MADENEEQWFASARALGLTLRKQTWRSHIADNFGKVMCSLGPAVTSPGEARDTWMVGRRHGAHVVVDGSWPESIKSGKRRLVTEVVVAIDPPLLVGLRVANTSVLQLRAGPDFDIGHPELDPKFEISAFIRERAARLLLPHAERLLALRSRSDWMLVTDNIVHVGFSGRFLDVATLGPAIDIVIETADALATERASMPELEAELPYKGWLAFARARDLAFDPLRMKIEGEINGIELEARFCTANGSPYAAARARIPRPLGLGLRIGAQTTDDGATIFFDDDSPDIDIGDPTFDETFVIEASDENRARAVLAAPAIRHSALDIVRAGGDIVITDTSVAASLRGAPGEGRGITPARLDWLLTHVTTLAGALGGGTGPYR